MKYIKHPTTTKACEICDKIIARARRGKTKFFISWQEYQKRRFCSTRCKSINLRNHTSGEKHYLWSGGKPKCIDCNIQLTTYSNTRCKKCWVKYHRGEDHSGWKEIPTNYKYVHSSLRKIYGAPKKCDFCGDNPSKLEWANKEGNYTRNITDYFGLCVPCHRKFDCKSPKRNKA